MEEWKGAPLVKAKDRKAWRTWLQKNHAKGMKAWLVIPHKGKVRTDLNYNSAVEEALCFGWVDSTANKYDEVSSVQYFARRKPKSMWSASNRERVARLIRKGLMTTAGQKLIDLAKHAGTWEALVPVQTNVAPDDLRRALRGNK